MSDLRAQGGAAFLTEALSPNESFAPEMFSEEQSSLREQVSQFVSKEVLPRAEKLEELDVSATRDLMRSLGELGLLSCETPVEYGGAGLGLVECALITESLARYPSLGVTHGVHTGLGTYPILYMGNEEQKRRFLPRLGSGEYIAALACTEPEAGSDIFGVRTTATPAMGRNGFVLNGEKAWISNSGFADVFMTFAKVEGLHPAFLAVERNSPGLTLGAEELKMGLKGSSTRAVHFDDVFVPSANLVGRAGKAQNGFLAIMNRARFKLSAGCWGLSREATAIAARHVHSRQQFGRPLSSFPAVQVKLAEMASESWVAESVIFRLAGLLDCWQTDEQEPRAWKRKLQEHTLECSIVKVFASELMGRVVDQGVQLLGGCGFSARFPIERLYRDARVFRIFEGTNEMMRIVSMDWLRQLHQRGRVDFDLVRRDRSSPKNPRQALLQAARRMMAEISIEAFAAPTIVPIEDQELSMAMADISIEILALESAELRAARHPGGWQQAAADVYSARSWFRIAEALRQAAQAQAGGDRLQSALAGWAATPGPNVASVRRQFGSFIAREGGLPTSHASAPVS